MFSRFNVQFLTDNWEIDWHLSVAGCHGCQGHAYWREDIYQISKADDESNGDDRGQQWSDLYANKNTPQGIIIDIQCLCVSNSHHKINIHLAIYYNNIIIIDYLGEL